MGELYIRSSDNLNGLNNLIGLLLQPLLTLFGDRQHRGGTKRIPGMNPQRVDILNKAYGNNIILRITHHFQFQFFPAENGFFHQDLAYQTGLKPPGTDYLQFFFIIYQPAAGAPHRISRAEHHRISQPFRDRKGFLHRIGHFAARHFNAQAVHRFLKLYTVFPTFDSIRLHANNFHLILIQDSRFI